MSAASGTSDPIGRVRAFYRAQLESTWTGLHDLPNGLFFDDRLAPIETLTVTPLPEGSRVTITRRHERHP